MNDKIGKLIKDFKDLKPSERDSFYKQLMDEDNLDFVSLTTAYIRFLEDDRNKNSLKLYGALTLGEINSKQLSTMKNKQLGQEYIALLIRSGLWKTAPIENEWITALEGIEINEERMKMWGYPEEIK